MKCTGISSYNSNAIEKISLIYSEYIQSKMINTKMLITQCHAHATIGSTIILQVYLNKYMCVKVTHLL